MTPRRFDIVVFGASSFVGELLSRYLGQRHGAASELRWALAGRSQSKLEAVRSGLGKQAAELPILLADSADEASLRKLCEQTRVVVSTVGPYALYGEPLVKVCAETGTHYCDLTGEPQWIARMLARYEAAAKRSGARIVHCCGFDSIPSDLGVWFLQQQAKARFGHPLPRVKMRVKAIRGGVSGGTVASLMNAVKEAARDPALRREIANPYSLCPPGYQNRTRQPNVKFAQHDLDFGWVSPFVMAAINTRIVQRSHALSEQAYGADFRYDEAVLNGRGLKGRLSATGMASGLAGFMLATALPPTRWALERFVLPAPGSGPTPQQQESGFFDLRFHASDEHGHTLRCKVTGDRDPGYGSTAKMLGEAAACLAFDLGEPGPAGGFWTPATLLGQKLIDRLQQHAGVRFELIES